MTNPQVAVRADRTVVSRTVELSKTPGTPNQIMVTNDAGYLPPGCEGVPRWGILTETWLKSDFTDGGGTSGTRVMTGSIPAGALLFLSRVFVNVAWTGDTTATLTIGDGSDVDRYNTGTPSLFTLAATGVEVGVCSGSKLQIAAVSPVLTVTSSADFTNVNTLGSVTVSICYLVPT